MQYRLKSARHISLTNYIHTFSYREFLIWHSLIHTPESTNMAAVQPSCIPENNGHHPLGTIWEITSKLIWKIFLTILNKIPSKLLTWFKVSFSWLIMPSMRARIESDCWFTSECLKVQHCLYICARKHESINSYYWRNEKNETETHPCWSKYTGTSL